MILGLIVAGVAIGQSLFVVVYLFQPWWQSQVGRAVFIDKLSMAIFVDALCFRVIFPDLVSRNVAIILYAVVMLAIWYQLITLVRVRLKARKNEVPTVS